MNRYPQSGIAQILANKGREGDTTLVHMAPSEVAGLQQLARSKGTSLSINPHTGLPEAKNILDYLGQGSGYGSTVAGALLGAVGIDAATSAALVGASQLISSGGDFEAGVTAAFGAAGGNKLEQMAEGAIGNLGQKWDAFKQGWSTPTTKFTPTTGSIGGTQLQDINLSNIPSRNLPILKSDLSGVEGSVAEPFGADWDQSNYVRSSIDSGLKAPEKVAETLTTPTTIETTTEGKSYLPSFVTDNPLTRGIKAMQGVGNAPVTASTTRGGITSLNADQTAQLKNLNDLKTSGAITEQEFTAAKNNLFNIAGKPSTAEDLQSLMKLATMGRTEHLATEQEKKLAAEEAATKAAMAPKPVPYGGMRSVQVRNPKFGQIGQPMYLQYYAKPGEASAGGVREMTPSELNQYNQSGKFVPGAAGGGLTTLLRGLNKPKEDAQPKVYRPVGLQQVAAENMGTYFRSPTQPNPVAGNRKYYQDLLDANLAKKKILTTAGT